MKKGIIKAISAATAAILCAAALTGCGSGKTSNTDNNAADTSKSSAKEQLDNGYKRSIPSV